MRRIGVLMGLAESDPVVQARLSALVRGLREFGWTERRNLRIEFRAIPSGGIDRIRKAVEGLRRAPGLPSPTGADSDIPAQAGIRRGTTLPVLAQNSAQSDISTRLLASSASRM
jgi:hypothetical protein